MRPVTQIADGFFYFTPKSPKGDFSMYSPLGVGGKKAYIVRLHFCYEKISLSSFLMFQFAISRFTFPLKPDPFSLLGRRGLFFTAEFAKSLCPLRNTWRTLRFFI